jgi:hypothetical protein
LETLGKDHRAHNVAMGSGICVKLSDAQKYPFPYNAGLLKSVVSSVEAIGTTVAQIIVF